MAQMNGITDAKFDAAMERLGDARGSIQDVTEDISNAESCECLTDLRTNISNAISNAEDVLEALRIAAKKVGAV
jgi:UDP-N-acetylmuramyl tripeptide synthase